MKRLEGQVAIVTGAGRGIGRAIALALAAEGAHITLSSRTQTELDVVAAEIEQIGGQALVVVADLTNAQQVNRMAEATISRFGAIHILVNNAGGMPSERYAADGSLFLPPSLWEIPEEIWDGTLATNLKSLFLCLKVVMPHVIQQQRGEVINISSQAGRTLFHQAADYCVAKHGAILLTEIAALQAAPHGVRVNAISPGLVDTPGQRRLMATFMPEDRFPPMISAESIAAAALYLLCDAPKAMTGQTLDLFNVRG
jgi:3-oxoacyl-[acyl-carrier protein] reductase